MTFVKLLSRLVITPVPLLLQAEIKWFELLSCFNELGSSSKFQIQQWVTGQRKGNSQLLQEYNLFVVDLTLDYVISYGVKFSQAFRAGKVCSLSLASSHCI